MQLNLRYNSQSKPFFIITSSLNCALFFLIRMSKVCKHWYEVACHPSLWSKMDFSYGWIKLNDDRLKWLCENRLTQLREVNFGTLKMMTNSSVEVNRPLSWIWFHCHCSFCYSSDKVNTSVYNKWLVLSSFDVRFYLLYFGFF